MPGITEKFEKKFHEVATAWTKKKYFLLLFFDDFDFF